MSRRTAARWRGYKLEVEENWFERCLAGEVSWEDIVCVILHQDIPTVAGMVRAHVSTIPEGRPFATWLFLNYGPRSHVDQTLMRMVRNGEINRIVRGVFIKQKPGSERLSTLEVAREKARSFCNELVGPPCAHNIDVNEHGELEVTYLTSGHSTSFRYGDIRIRLKNVRRRRRPNGAVDNSRLFGPTDLLGRVGSGNAIEWSDQGVVAELNGNAARAEIA